eukprot:gene26790-33425_t
MTTGATSQSTALDIWAAGVIFYWLVTGSPPFNRPPKEERNGPPPDFDTKFVEPSSDILSAEGRDLLRLLLQKDPLKRPSARQALNHAVFTALRSSSATSTPNRSTNGEEVSSLTHLSPGTQFAPQANSHSQQPMRTVQSTSAPQTSRAQQAPVVLNRRLEFDHTPVAPQCNPNQQNSQQHSQYHSECAASQCVKEAERGRGSGVSRNGPVSHRILTVSVL